MKAHKMKVTIPEDHHLVIEVPESFRSGPAVLTLEAVAENEARHAAAEKPSRWARLVQRIEEDPVHLDGYSRQLEKDSREFRDGFEFRHDRDP